MGIFVFKQFSVCDDSASMKVGTDAVLLGAWASLDGAKTILDIGTGSGVIALMLAQRSSSGTEIDAVELQEADAAQASANVASSPWPGKVKVTWKRIQQFSPGKKYDLIVSNPPFFSNSLLPPSRERSHARHHQSLSKQDLIAATIRLLAPHGKLCVIMPVAEGKAFVREAEASRLYPQQVTRFFTRPDKPQERSLLQLGFDPLPLMDHSLTLYEADGRWSTEYRLLTHDFYLER